MKNVIHKQGYAEKPVENPSYDGKARFCVKCNAWFAGWRIERMKDGVCPGCNSVMYNETQLMWNPETELLELKKD